MDSDWQYACACKNRLEAWTPKALKVTSAYSETWLVYTSCGRVHKLLATRGMRVRKVAEHCVHTLSKQAPVLQGKRSSKTRDRLKLRPWLTVSPCFEILLCINIALWCQ